MKFRHPLTMMAVMISEELRAERINVTSILPRLQRRRFAELTQRLQEAEDALADISTIDPNELSLTDILDGVST